MFYRFPADALTDKSPKELVADKHAENVNHLNDSENGCVSNNDVNANRDGPVQNVNNNNNSSPSKLCSKSAGDTLFEDKSQTEDEVQKLMTIALSNNQKRLERACLNASDKPNINRLQSTEGIPTNEIAMESTDTVKRNADFHDCKESENQTEENVVPSDDIKNDNDSEMKESKKEKFECISVVGEAEEKVSQKSTKIDESKPEFCVPEGKNERIFSK